MFPENLAPVEVRVLGSLIEKELSTPDHYPLSLNALTSACNQSSNRDPVMSLDEGTVSRAIDTLRRQGLVRSIQGIGSRVPKYQHLMAEFFSRPELAVLCVLAVRGPQTQAEVRTRAARLMPGDDSAALDAALEALVTRDAEPVVARLSRRPGQKEARYAHLLSGAVAEAADDGQVASPPPSSDRLAALEELALELRNEVADLRAQLASFRRQFE
ncbi:MAG TPA: YceH family protein [Gemmatimonadaceae bacterium]|nr:YceH family protein [Gemmatimonadaceae bacterium]